MPSTGYDEEPRHLNDVFGPLSLVSLDRSLLRLNVIYLYLVQNFQHIRKKKKKKDDESPIFHEILQILKLQTGSSMSNVFFISPEMDLNYFDMIFLENEDYIVKKKCTIINVFVAF